MGRYKEAQIRAAEALQASKGTRTPLRTRDAPAGPFVRFGWPFVDTRSDSPFAHLPRQDLDAVRRADDGAVVAALAATGGRSKRAKPV